MLHELSNILSFSMKKD